MTKEGARDDIRGKPSGKAWLIFEEDLDKGFDVGVRSWKDISHLTVKNALIGSRYLQILIALTLLGLFLRFYKITVNSFWLDEAYTYFFSRNSFIDIWFTTGNGEPNPPLFYWIEHCMLYIGNNEFILRFVPAVLGISTIPLMYFLGKEFLDRNCGIIMAALLTVSLEHIYYSQDARAYTTMLFFITLALIFYFRALRTNVLRSWVLFGLFSGFAFWTHFYACIPVISLFCVAVGINAGKIREEVRYCISLIKGAAVFILVSLPLIIVEIGLISSGPKFRPPVVLEEQGMTLIINIMKALSGIPDHVSPSWFSSKHLLGYSSILLTLTLVLFVIGILTVFVIERKKAYILIVMLVIPLAISWGISYHIGMSPRYVIALIPVYFMGIAASYKLISNLIKSKRVVYLFILVLIFINIPFLVSYYQTPVNSDWRALSEMIRDVARPGDIIVLYPNNHQVAFDYYYKNQTTGIQEFGVISIRQLDEIFQYKGENRIFYVVSWWNPSIMEWLNNHAIKIDKCRKDTGIDLFIST